MLIHFLRHTLLSKTQEPEHSIMFHISVRNVGGVERTRMWMALIESPLIKLCVVKRSRFLSERSQGENQSALFQTF